MKNNFPPSPVQRDAIQILLELFTSVIDGRNAVYLSAPITSGKRFSNWYNQNGKTLDYKNPDYHRNHLREVIEPNRAHAKDIVRKLRNDLKGILIDPTAVPDFPRWTQDDYRTFWALVIERYVHTVVFMDGWQYSLGCSYEFLIACRIGALTFDEYQRPLSIDEGMALIQTAISDMAHLHESIAFLECVVKGLKEVNSNLRENYA
jgi:hypothetical protein